MNPLRIFLLAALVLVVFGIGNAEAVEDKMPSWTHSPTYGNELVLSKNGDYLAVTASASPSSLRFFSSSSFTPLWEFMVPDVNKTYDNGDYDSEYQDAINDIDMSSNGDFILVSTGSTLFFFEKESNTPIWQNTVDCSYVGIETYSSCIADIDLSEDGNFVLFTTYAKSDGQNYLHNASINLFDSDNNSIWTYEFDDLESYRYVSPDEDSAIINGNSVYYIGTEDIREENNYFEKTLFLSFNLSNGDKLNELKSRYNDDKFYVDIPSDGPYGIITYPNDYIGAFDLNNFSTLWEISPNNFGNPYEFSTGNFSKMASCSRDAGLSLISIDSGMILWSFKDNDNNIRDYNACDTIISQDGSYVLYVHSVRDHDNDYFNMLYFFDTDIPNPLWVYSGKNSVSPGHIIALSGDGRFSASLGNNEHQLLLFNSNLNDYPSCTHGQIKLDEDGFNQCICNNGEWLCTDVECSADVSYNPENDDSVNEENDGTTDSTPCETGESKVAEDGCNQCVCNDGNWVCTEIDCVVSEDEEGLLPSISLITSLISIGLLAIFRRK